jgi:hypothetical protein
MSRHQPLGNAPAAQSARSSYQNTVPVVGSRAKERPAACSNAGRIVPSAIGASAEKGTSPQKTDGVYSMLRMSISTETGSPFSSSTRTSTMGKEPGARVSVEET